MPKNDLQGIFIEPSVDAELREEIDWSMLNYTAVTDVEFYYWAYETCENCDVKIRAVDYGANGWWASSSCEFAGAPTVYGGSEAPLPGSRWCRAQVFRYNLYYRAAKYPTDNNERAVTCHELGHTLGLRHPDSTTGDPNWTDSCMKNGNQTKITTTTHDRNHVNARY